MSPDWLWAQRKYSHAIAKNGTVIQWLIRTQTGSTAYETGSTDTYGYGDPISYFSTGSCQAIISHVSATDVITEAGFWIDDYEKIFVDPNTNISEWSQIIYPSGSSQKYLILSIHPWRANGDIVVAKYAIIRRLVPRSGSMY